MRHPVDVHVGQRVRYWRWMVGMTQHHLGEIAGVTSQQIQKYETGRNCISASRLWDISIALKVPVAFFFEGYQDDNDTLFSVESGGPGGILGDKEALELVRSYYAIPQNQRRRLLELARVMGVVAE